MPGRWDQTPSHRSEECIARAGSALRFLASGFGQLSGTNYARPPLAKGDLWANTKAALISTTMETAAAPQPSPAAIIAATTSAIADNDGLAMGQWNKSAQWRLRAKLADRSWRAWLDNSEKGPDHVSHNAWSDLATRCELRPTNPSSSATSQFEPKGLPFDTRVCRQGTDSAIGANLS